MNKGHTMLKSLTLSLLALSIWAADPPEKGKEVPLPAPVIRAEDVMNDAVAKARSAYLKAVEAEVKRLQAVLEKEKAAATKAGLLEVAMAIKAKQESLVAAEVAGKALEGAGELLGDAKPDLAKAIVGKWKYALKASAGILIVDNKGNVTHPQGFTGKIQTVDDKTVIVWSNNTKWDIVMKEGSIYVNDDASESKLVK